MSLLNHQTTSQELIWSIRNKVNSFRAKFPGLKSQSIGVGFLQQSPTMPAMTVMPSRWTISNRHSGGRYNVGREIEVQFYADGKNAGQADDRLRGHVEKFLDILVKDRGYFFESNGRKTAFNFDYGAIRYSTVPGSLRGFKVREGIIPLTIYSREYRPAQKRWKGKVVKVSDNELYEIIFKELLNNKHGKFKGVKEFRRNTEMPKGTGLTIGMQFSSVAPVRHAAGMDLYNFLCEVTVWNKALPDNKSILKNLEVAENVKEVFEQDATFGGVLWNSETQSMEFGVEESDSKVSLYVTRVGLLCSKYKTTKQSIGGV